VGLCFIIPSIYGYGFTVKILKTRHKISVDVEYTDIFYSVRLPTHGFAVYDTIHFDGFFYEFGNQIREFSMSKPASHEFSFHDTKHMSLCKPRFYPNTLHVALGKIAGIVEYAGV